MFRDWWQTSQVDESSWERSFAQMFMAVCLVMYSWSKTKSGLQAVKIHTIEEAYLHCHLLLKTRYCRHYKMLMIPPSSTVSQCFWEKLLGGLARTKYSANNLINKITYIWSWLDLKMKCFILSNAFPVHKLFYYSGLESNVPHRQC